MRIVVGVYAYLTKLSIIELKSKLNIPYTYVRDTYDYLLLKPDNKTTVKITQDGLLYLDFQGGLDDISRKFSWLQENVMQFLELLDEEDIFYRSIFGGETSDHHPLPRQRSAR